jgi:hypothetical protein
MVNQLLLCAGLLVHMNIFRIPIAAAQGCSTRATFEIRVGQRTFYVDDRRWSDTSLEIWIYEESNDQLGLQRGGPHWIAGETDLPDVLGPDACVDSSTPDKLWF